jgi:hypothetical protein
LRGEGWGEGDEASPIIFSNNAFFNCQARER